MQIIADFHIHSKYSRACSRDLILEKIDETCQKKGVDVVATGDFTHPEWFKELKNKLIEKEKGLYVLKTLPPPPIGKGGISNEKNLSKVDINIEKTTRFICSTEISCIYAQGGKVRRLHIVVLAPNLETVEKINLALGRRGNLKSDGRPILGLSGKELAKIIFAINPNSMIIPAHIWTPWFAVFGSKSGFNSLEECFEEITPQIYAIETGLSSDPPMNWRVKNLDNISITSNSDAHSLPNIAREANVFEIVTSPDPPLAPPERGMTDNGLSYKKICQIIKDKNPQEFLYTVEFYPEEGMYHYDGHRLCNFSCAPTESKRLKNICPVCKKPLTIGVMNRVDELAEKDRDENYLDKKRVPYKKLVELDKIIAESLNIKSRSSRKVIQEYDNLIKQAGTEFNILLKLPLGELENMTQPQIVEGVKRVRQGHLKIKPGYDGQYGEVRIFSDQEKLSPQKSLF